MKKIILGLGLISAMTFSAMAEEKTKDNYTVTMDYSKTNNTVKKNSGGESKSADTLFSIGGTYNLDNVKLLDEDLKLYGSFDFGSTTFETAGLKSNNLSNAEFGVKNSYIELSYVSYTRKFDAADELTSTKYKYNSGAKSGQPVLVGKTNIKRSAILSGLKVKGIMAPITLGNKASTLKPFLGLQILQKKSEDTYKKVSTDTLTMQALTETVSGEETGDKEMAFEVKPGVTFEYVLSDNIVSKSSAAYSFFKFKDFDIKTISLVQKFDYTTDSNTVISAGFTFENVTNKTSKQTNTGFNVGIEF